VAHTGSSGEPSFLSAVLLAFAGGAILNLMPCVFPVLFLKALALELP
jgi:thiol:disulfide interchange protein DsbD